MNWSLFLTLISIIATLIFGFLSISIYKRKKYPGKITLIKQSIISLFNNIAKNFEEISIQYKESPIKDNVIYIKSSFINDGDLDIEGTAVERPISLELNKGFQWIKSKITKMSPELSVENMIIKDENSLMFKFGLFRRKEFFQFEALVETNDENCTAEDLFDNMKINHRIANTQKIKQDSILSEEQLLKKKGRIKKNSILFLSQAVILVLLFSISTLFLKKEEVHYQDNKNHESKSKSCFRQYNRIKRI